MAEDWFKQCTAGYKTQAFGQSTADAGNRYEFWRAGRFTYCIAISGSAASVHASKKLTFRLREADGRPDWRDCARSSRRQRFARVLPPRKAPAVIAKLWDDRHSTREPLTGSTVRSPQPLLVLRELEKRPSARACWDTNGSATAAWETDCTY